MNKTFRINLPNLKGAGGALCAFGLLLFLISPGLLAHERDEDEIKLLISNAPLAGAIQEGKGEELLAVYDWFTALAYSGRAEEAYALSPKVRKGMTTEECLAAISDGLRLAGKTDQALSVARKTKRSAEVAIRILLRVERYADAIAEAKTISDVGERAQEFCLIGKLLARSGRTDQALGVAQETRVGTFGDYNLDQVLAEVALRLALDGKGAKSIAVAQRISSSISRLIAMRGCVANLARVGKTTDAIAYASAITDSEIRSSAMLVVTEALCKNGHSVEALGIATRIEDPYSRSQALVATAIAIDQTGRSDQFTALLNQARSAARDVKKPFLRDQAISNISRDLAKSGLVDIALSTAQECLDDNERSWAYDEVTTAMLKAGRYEEAFEIAKGTSFGQRETSLALVVETVNLSPGAQAFRQTVNNRSYYKPEDYAALAQGLAAAGRIEEAIVVASAITYSQDQRCFAFLNISASLARSGSYKQAHVAADNCSSHLRRLGAYTYILTAYAVSRNPKLKAALAKESTFNW